MVSCLPRPWYTIEEYAMGEDGCEAIDCLRCRNRMDAALQRYWGSDQHE